MKRLTRKVFSCVMATALFTAQVSAGNTNVRILREDGANDTVVQKILVEGSAEKFSADEQVTLRVIPADTATMPAVPSGYILLSQEFINEDGSFSFEKEIDALPGDIKIYVNSINDTFEEKQIYFPSADAIKDLISGLNSGTVSASDAAAAVKTDNINLVFDTSIYDMLSDAGKTKVFSDMKAENEPFTVTNIYNLFDKHTLFNAMAEKSDAATVEKIISNYENRTLNLKSEKAYETFNGLTPAKKNLVYSAMGNKTYTDISQIRNAFYEATVTVVVKNIDSHLNILGILERYQDEMGLASEVTNMKNNALKNNRVIMVTSGWRQRKGPWKLF